ncbi:hypothetical protein ACQUET_13280, partial [Lactococcus lactis]
DPASSTFRFLGTWSVSAAVALGVGAAIPISSRNVLGQGLSGGVAIGAYLALSLTLQPLGTDRAELLVALSLVLFVASV